MNLLTRPSRARNLFFSDENDDHYENFEESNNNGDDDSVFRDFEKHFESDMCPFTTTRLVLSAHLQLSFIRQYKILFTIKVTFKNAFLLLLRIECLRGLFVHAH